MVLIFRSQISRTLRLVYNFPLNCTNSHINLEPTLVPVLRNKSSRILGRSPINNTEHKFRGLLWKQGNTIPVRVAEFEHVNQSLPLRSMYSGIYH